MSAISLGSKNVSGSLLAGNVGFATAYEHIQSITVGSLSADSVTFYEIPQNYRHLQIRGLVRGSQGTVGNAGLYCKINGDTSTTHAMHRLYGVGDGNANSNGYISQGGTYGIELAGVGIVPWASSTANAFGVFITDIVDYSNTVKNKTFKSIVGIDLNTNDTNGRVSLTSCLWTNTSAINSISLSAGGILMVQHTTFSLYGVR